MRRRWLAIAVMLTVPSACDNVTWGGVDVHLQAPPTQAESAAGGMAEPAEESAEQHPDLPEGPILLAGTRDGASATLTVVGEIRGDTVLEPPTDDSVPGYRDYFVRRLLAPGAEFVLFAEGVRVGRLTVTEAGVDQRFCVPRPTVTGIVELVPSAAGARRLLAISVPEGTARPYGDYRALQDDYDQRVASLRLASEAVPQVGAAWPPSILEARADIQAFRLPGAEGPSIAATFLYNDQLTTAAPGPGGYALFLTASERGGEYGTDYLWYRSVESEGKGAPRYLGHLDLDGDGSDEILLDVFGNGTRWFAGLARRSGSWTRAFQDTCGRPASGPSR